MTLGQDVLETLPDLVIILPPHCSVEKTKPDATKEYCDDSVGNEDDRDWGEEGVPEPEDKIDLLIDDVLGEDTQPIVTLKIRI